MARRIKSSGPALVSITSWEEADDLIRQIWLGQQSIQSREAGADNEIKKVKAALAADINTYQQAIKLYTRSLEAFAAAHKADFGGARSRRLNFGTLGWRKSTSVKVANATLELIKSVFRPSKARQFIHVKETVNREALAKLTDEELAGVKARREVKDAFFVEPDLTKAAQY